ncbi:LOW QUALITY PROTEIN: zinc finger SWIM domain-containing protein 3 [Cariama cristata]
MELGVRLKSYEDFRERFRTRKLTQGCRYGLRSCVSVRCHSRQHGTAVREDVMFMQVKCGCAQTQKYSKRRKQPPSLCLAYFVLQYKEDTDRLVISEPNSDDVHADPVFSLTRATTVTASMVACDSPATKLHKQQQEGGTESGAQADEDSRAVAGQPVEGVPALYRAPALPEAMKENASASALVRVPEVVKTFLRVGGSLASISTDSDHSLDRLSFQTSKMKSSFMQFPESLLLHRVPKHILYAFLVESKERAGKVVHLLLLKDDTGHSIRKMLTVFKEFNPKWQKVQAVFVDVSFHKAILRELFPSAQVLLSVCDTVRLLEKNMKEAEISSSFKQHLMLAVQKAVFLPSAASLDAFSQLVKPEVSSELDYLQANWFSCELLWCMHGEKGPRSFATHTDSLDLIPHQISSLFGQQPSLEASVLHFLECADCLDSRGLESLNQGFLSTERGSRSTLQEKPDVRVGAAAEPGPVSGSPALVKCPELTGQAVMAGMGCMPAMLHESRTDLGSWLCLKEWEVVQTSTQLLSPAPGSLVVRLLEDAHQVSRDCRSCSCSFPRLPCRHVLAVLQAHRACVEEGMVCRRWRRRYQHLPAPGASLPGRDGGSAGGRTEGRGERVRSLSLELANLLMQGEGEELEERSSALAAILAAWARSAGPGEAAGKEAVLSGAPRRCVVAEGGLPAVAGPVRCTAAAPGSARARRSLRCPAGTGGWCRRRAEQAEGPARCLTSRRTPR